MQGDKKRMIYEKTVKVSKQGGCIITIPKVMCEMLKITPESKLKLTFDTETETIQMKKEIES